MSSGMSAQYQLAGGPEDATDGALVEEVWPASPPGCTLEGGCGGGGTDGAPPAAENTGTGGYCLPAVPPDPGAAPTADLRLARRWALTACAPCGFLSWSCAVARNTSSAGARPCGGAGMPCGRCSHCPGPALVCCTATGPGASLAHRRRLPLLASAAARTAAGRSEATTRAVTASLGWARPPPWWLRAQAGYMRGWM